jgi:DNA-binding SARP family transcriptional activator
MLCLLGQPVVLLDGHTEPVLLQPKALALLAYLALNERKIGRYDLAHLLFPETAEPRAVLRWHLNHIRSAAPDCIGRALQATRDHISLSIPTDVMQFRLRAERIMHAPAPSDAHQLLALYRDDLLPGLAISATADFDTWLYIEQESLRRLFRQATVAFARWTLSNHSAFNAIGALSRLVSVDPYLEDGHVLLIEAYESLNQQDRAKAAYERYQHIMRKELHAEPHSVVASRFEQAPTPARVHPHDELVPLREVTIHVVDWPGCEPAILAIHGSGMSA